LRKQGSEYSFSSPTVGRAFGLCASERFVAQPAAAFCSGALIGPDLVVTAGHCLPHPQDCTRTAFVFDFEIKKGRSTFGTVPEKSVYSCRSLVHTQTGPEGDFAIVRLDRIVTSRKPMGLRSGDAPAPGTTLALLGYPMGIPLKYAAGAVVRDSGGPFFISSLDAYAGNSGSPIVNPRTYRLEGVLSRGEEDFDVRGVCLVSRRCPEDGCGGEEATDISRIRARLLSLKK
jgi:V8-like Glu-specific endopeptidase